MSGSVTRLRAHPGARDGVRSTRPVGVERHDVLTTHSPSRLRHAGPTVPASSSVPSSRAPRPVSIPDARDANATPFLPRRTRARGTTSRARLSSMTTPSLDVRAAASAVSSRAPFSASTGPSSPDPRRDAQALVHNHPPPLDPPPRVLRPPRDATVPGDDTARPRVILRVPSPPLPSPVDQPVPRRSLPRRARPCRRVRPRRLRRVRFTRADDEASWFLEEYQKTEGQGRALMAQMRAGVHAIASNPEALLVFSGGKTRLDAGERRRGGELLAGESRGSLDGLRRRRRRTSRLHGGSREGQSGERAIQRGEVSGADGEGPAESHRGVVRVQTPTLREGASRGVAVARGSIRIDGHRRRRRRGKLRARGARWRCARRSRKTRTRARGCWGRRERGGIRSTSDNRTNEQTRTSPTYSDTAPRRRSRDLCRGDEDERCTRGPLG